MLGKSGFLHASPHILSKIADAFDRVFREIVIPRHAIMSEEREQAVAIFQQPFS